MLALGTRDYLSNIHTHKVFDSSSSEAIDDEEEEEGVDAAVPNEWERIKNEFPTDVERLVVKYPVAALVTIVVFSILGISTLFSFSLKGWITSFILIGIAAGMGVSIRNQQEAFMDNAKKTLEYFKDMVLKRK